jgi:hypothetical protein
MKNALQNIFNSLSISEKLNYSQSITCFSFQELHAIAYFEGAKWHPVTFACDDYTYYYYKNIDKALRVMSRAWAFEMYRLHNINNRNQVKNIPVYLLDSHFDADLIKKAEKKQVYNKVGYLLANALKKEHPPL